MTSLERIADQLEQLAALRRMKFKTLLTIEEAAVFTNLSVGYLYRLTSERKIPHFKKMSRLYFDKQQLNEWLRENPVKTQAEIEAEADTYILNSSNKRTNRLKKTHR